MYCLTLFLACGLTPDVAPLESLARTIASQIVAEPEDVAAVYHQAFLTQLPEQRLAKLFQEFHSKYGGVRSVVPIKQDTPYSGQFHFDFEKNVRMKVSLGITTTPPHQIVMLWFGPPAALAATLDEIVEQIKALPGRVGFQLARLHPEPTVLHAHQADQALAIGSTFKLYVLGALLQDGRSWDTVVRLDPAHRSLPSGVLQTWPAGAPLTLHTLATQMISISDNTAGDQLLHLVGRERVEKLLSSLGHSDPRKSVPFLSTLEMFKLKTDPQLLTRYEQADLAGRRALLAGEVASFPRDRVRPYQDGRPLAIERVEWFASAADLCRVMDWFRKKNDAVALDILAVNKGLDVSETDFLYAGFKGGSEPGVVNLTWLLKRRDGVDFAVSASWNNAEVSGAPVGELTSLMQPLIDLLGEDAAAAKE